MRRNHFVVLALLTTVVSLALVPAAWASLGGTGTKGQSRGHMTSQRWILGKAIAAAATAGADWLDPSAASAAVSGRDAAGHDLRYSTVGGWDRAGIRGAAARITSDYALVVESLDAGDTNLASQRFGLLARSFIALCDPLHAGDCRAERARRNGKPLHARIDLAVMRALNRARARGIGSAADRVVASSGTATIARCAMKAAFAARHDYRREVRGYLRHGFSPQVRKIASSYLRRGVVGLSGMILRAQKDKGKLRPNPTPSPSVSPTPSPTAIVISVPGNATQAQIDACVAKAVATGPGTWVVFPAGKFAYTGTFVVPDYINIGGQGIWNQGSADGSGGTWLQCTRGLRWGSNSTIEDLLVGQNASGGICTFSPVPRGSSAAGQFTCAHGSQHCTFECVRFKGGSDTGAHLIDLGGNWNASWSGALKKYDMVDTSFNDCEFERPQSTNATNGTSGDYGNILNIWWDSRSGGAQVHDLAFNRCHFGVKNSLHTGIDQYGIGGNILFQPAPAGLTDGPSTNGSSAISPSNYNSAFDWSLVEHGAHDISFTDCLFEYSLRSTIDPCDFARQWSLWHSCHDGYTDGGASHGYGNPPGTCWTSIPTPVWLDRFSMTRCYMKGSTADLGNNAEITRNTTIAGSYCGTGRLYSQGGMYGNVVSGSFSNSNRPSTSLFTTDWSGSTTSYTPSPYDP